MGTKNVDILKLQLVSHYQYINKLIREKAELQRQLEASVFLDNDGRWCTLDYDYLYPKFEEKRKELDKALETKTELENEYEELLGKKNEN